MNGPSDNDLEVCRAMIRTGSLSFHAASRLLPASVRDPALVLYAFCRIADDEVDEVATPDKAHAVLRLRDRLDQIYAGRPRNAPCDRAFAAVVDTFDMPRTLPDALLEGLAWDACGQRYDTLSGVLDYSARVAAAVGAMMCVLMQVRDADVLARACDLGLAMQLTNIARDVGEDARAGRLFLPLDWLRLEGVDPDAFVAIRRPIPASVAPPPACCARPMRFTPGPRRAFPACPWLAVPASLPRATSMPASVAALPLPGSTASPRAPAPARAPSWPGWPSLQPVPLHQPCFRRPPPCTQGRNPRLRSLSTRRPAAVQPRPGRTA